MKQIIILLDYKNEFQCSIQDLHNYTTMNIEKVMTYFKELNYSVKVMRFNEIDFEAKYKGIFVIYHSAEDKGLFYKSYIEDVCLFLNNSGAILLPKLSFLRAHHNKSFMEMMRYQFKSSKIKSIKSSIYGVYDDIKTSKLNYPFVLKISEGAGSNNVVLIHNRKELQRYSKKMLRIIYSNSYIGIIKTVIIKLLRKKGKREYTDFRNKFIIQNYIPFLSCDYKVLYYSGKYYILGRKTRKNDFRASGSGMLFTVNELEAYGILDFSRLIVSELNEPIIGLDIAFDGTEYYLLEFQVGIFLGPFTLQCSDHWYEFSVSNNKWEKKIGNSELEKEYCRSIHEKILSLENQP